MDAEARHITPLRDRLIKGILERIPQTYLNGHRTRRLPNNVNISVASVEGESLAVSLDLDFIDPDDAPGVGTPVRGCPKVVAPVKLHCNEEQCAAG